MDKFYILLDDYGKLKCLTDDENLMRKYVSQRFVHPDSIIKIVKDDYIVNYVYLFYDNLELESVGDYVVTSDEKRFIDEFIKDEPCKTILFIDKFKSIAKINSVALSNNETVMKDLSKLYKSDVTEYSHSVNDFIETYMSNDGNYIDFKIDYDVIRKIY